MKQSVVPSNLPQQVRVLQQIWLALTMGLVAACVVFWYLREQKVLEEQRPVGNGPPVVLPADEHGDVHDPLEEVPLAGILAGVGGLTLLLGLILPPQLGAKMPATFAAYQSQAIIQAALFEGAGMMQGIAYLLEGQWWSLALAGVCILFLIFTMPTRDSATRWIQHPRR